MFIVIKCERIFFAVFLFFLFFTDTFAYMFNLSEKNPIYVDRLGKKIYLFTKLNRNALSKKNPHFGVVYEKGTMAKNAPFNAFVDPITFYNELNSIGLKPGNNLSENRTGEFVVGSEIKVSVIYEGKEFTLSDVIDDTSGKGFLIKFGGNRDRQERMKTGCIMCLESCYAGITSNSKYPMISNIKRFFSPNSLFWIKEPFLKGSDVFIFVFWNQD